MVGKKLRLEEVDEDSVEEENPNITLDSIVLREVMTGCHKTRVLEQGVVLEERHRREAVLDLTSEINAADMTNLYLGG